MEPSSYTSYTGKKILRDSEISVICVGDVQPKLSWITDFMSYIQNKAKFVKDGK